MRTYILLFFTSLILGGLIPACSSAPDNAPNIIVILADDAGYADFGFMGGDIPTPNIDRLARQGVVFTDAHITATVCSPSRAGLITGRYQQRFGHEANIPPPDLGMDPSEETLGDALKLAGYRTGIIGKWHLGSGEKYHPNNRGFDEFWGFLQSGCSNGCGKDIQRRAQACKYLSTLHSGRPGENKRCSVSTFKLIALKTFQRQV
jgi:hypothetical protein